MTALQGLRHLATPLLGPLLGLLLLTPGQAAETVLYRDMAGREVQVPKVVRHAYATSQIGIIQLYSLNPDKLAGWMFPLGEVERAWIPARYQDKPILGGWSGKNGTANVEEIIRAHPDVIFSAGLTDDLARAQSDRLQRQTGIPVVMLDTPLTGMDKAYLEMGRLIGEADRAGELAAYCRQTLQRIGQQVAQVPADARRRVYYAEGPKGLETDPSGSMHAEVLDFVNGINVADVPMVRGFGRAEVSIEQVYRWDPDLILVGYDKMADDGFYGSLPRSPAWQPLRAVREQAVVQIPYQPFDWFDRPPSVNRLMGVVWLANLLYPQWVTLDLPEEIRRFYRLFYHLTLSDAQIETLLRHARLNQGGAHE